MVVSRPSSHLDPSASSVWLGVDSSYLGSGKSSSGKVIKALYNLLSDGVAISHRSLALVVHGWLGRLGDCAFGVVVFQTPLA